jgi:hypothetical protein
MFVVVVVEVGEKWKTLAGGVFTTTRGGTRMFGCTWSIGGINNYPFPGGDNSR